MIAATLFLWTRTLQSPPPSVTYSKPDPVPVPKRAASPALVGPPRTLAEAALRVQLPPIPPSRASGPRVGPIGAPPARVAIATVRPPLKPSQLPTIAVDSSNVPVYVPTATLDEESAEHEASEEARITTAAALAERKQAAEEQRLTSIMPEGPKFVMSLCRDLQGNIWAGSEGEGICCYDAALGQWRQYTTKDGLGDDNGYAVACDRLGRIWAGHLNHGVSVFNGEKWQNYEVVGGLSSPDSLSGPLGERVFAIKVCPTDGDVWLATNAGLARYSESLNSWAYYTRAHGLPSDQSQALAFDSEGNIYVGTQCDGIATAHRSDDYKKWKVATGPDLLGTEPYGEGLPTNLINDLLVTASGTVYAATTNGLAWSNDHGLQWRYMRGKDWAEKARRLYTGRPPGWTERPGAILAEDYITCLAEDSKKQLWIGYRTRGWDAVDPSSLQAVVAPPRDYYVRAILPTIGDPIVGTYGETPIEIHGPRLRGPTAPPAHSSLPLSAHPPSSGELVQLIDTVQPNGDSSFAASVGEDWATQGSWVGRYGRNYNMLCAMATPYNHKCVWTHDYHIVARLGPNHEDRDKLRGWVHWLETDNPKSLYNPIIGNRRQAEWDDHGEAYATSHDGPGIDIDITVPDGTHRISLYFFNDDGHESKNRFRDYLVTVTTPDIKDGAWLAKSRVRDFWGGVYKQFLVKGPRKYTFHLLRCGSLNTICSGVMIDKLTGPFTALDMQPMAWLGGIKFDASTGSDSLLAVPQQVSKSATLADQLWNAVTKPVLVHQTLFVQREYRLAALRSAYATKPAEVNLDQWRWDLCLWSPRDRVTFTQTMAIAWAEQLKQTPILGKYHGSGASQPDNSNIRKD